METSRWTKRLIGDLPIYQADNLRRLPGIVQGFTTRKGGTSAKPYDSLNLSFATDDSAEAVLENRRRLLCNVAAGASIAAARQVHGADVACLDRPVDAEPEADALVTNTPGLLLFLLFADCVPVYIVDPVRRVIALAHSGWRGTVKNVAGRAVQAMGERFGSDPRVCLVAIGPCICARHYEVGADVADQLRAAPGGHDAGAAVAVMPRNEFGNTWAVDLRQIIFGQLLRAGIRPEGIAVSRECTFHNRSDFFSHRRSTLAGEPTGRMAAILCLEEPAKS